MTNTQAAAWLRDALREDHDMREYTGKALMSDHRRSVYLVCLRALQGPHQDGNKAYINDHHKQEHALQEHALGRIDIPPGFDSVRANQCVICGAEMPEGDQVCRRCRRTAYPPKPNSGLLEED